MKKQILTFVFLFCVLFASSQTEKGTLLLAGSTALNFAAGNTKILYDGDTDYEYSLTSTEIIPSFGYFVQDNLAIGLMSNISIQTSKDEDGDKDMSNTTMLIPSAFYFFPMEGNLRPFVQLGAGYSFMVYKWIPKTGSNDKNSFGGLTINGGAGMAYFLKESISINLGLSYTNGKLKNKDDDDQEQKTSMFSTNVGISIYLN